MERGPLENFYFHSLRTVWALVGRVRAVLGAAAADELLLQRRRELAASLASSSKQSIPGSWPEDCQSSSEGGVVQDSEYDEDDGELVDDDDGDSNIDDYVVI